MTRRQTIIDSTARRSGRSRIAYAALATMVTLGCAATANALPTDWLAYTAIARTRLDIGSNIEVAGNYAVTQPGGELTLGTNLFHSSVPADSFLAADKMEFITGASANNVFVNSLQLNGTANVRGSTGPVTLPLTINVPALPPGVTNSCANSASNVTVGVGQTLSLAPGCYRNLLVNSNAVLELTGGDYIFRQALIEVDAQVIAETSTTISVQQRLTTELRSYLSPQSGNAADLQVFIGGSGNRIGNEGLLIGRIVAPNDSNFEFGVRATFIGNAYADGLKIFGVHLTRTPTPTEPFVPPEKCPAFTSPQPC